MRRNGSLGEDDRVLRGEGKVEVTTGKELKEKFSSQQEHGVEMGTRDWDLRVLTLSWFRIYVLTSLSAKITHFSSCTVLLSLKSIGSKKFSKFYQEGLFILHPGNCVTGGGKYDAHDTVKEHSGD